MNQMDVTLDQEKKIAAEQKLRMALDRLVKVAAHQIGHFADDLEGGVKASVESITASVVSGVREVKAELNVAESIRQQPLQWVAGAAAAGAALRLLAGSGRQQQWLIIAGELALMLLQKQRQLTH